MRVFPHIIALIAIAAAAERPLLAPTAAPAMTLDEAVARALQANPTALCAAAW